LQKWWTLNLARFSAADRYKGLSAEETDAQLASLLQFEVAGNKGGPKKSFGVGDFDEYLKLAASHAVLQERQTGLVALSSHANALYRSVVAEYEEIFSHLSRSKTMGLKDRLARVEKYREAILRRRADIADFLNWFEATQMDSNRTDFDGYLKASHELTAPARRSDPISKYLDEISQEL
jgi:hypothetical protein